MTHETKLLAAVTLSVLGAMQLPVLFALQLPASHHGADAFTTGFSGFGGFGEVYAYAMLCQWDIAACLGVLLALALHRLKSGWPLAIFLAIAIYGIASFLVLLARSVGVLVWWSHQPSSKSHEGSVP